MQSLHQQRTNATDQGWQASVHCPRRRIGAKVTDIITFAHLRNPLGNTCGITRNDTTKPCGCAFSQGSDHAVYGVHTHSLPQGQFVYAFEAVKFNGRVSV
jgi:hypothetical protein